MILQIFRNGNGAPPMWDEAKSFWYHIPTSWYSCPLMARYKINMTNVPRWNCLRTLKQSLPYATVRTNQHDEILFFVGDIICQWLQCLGQNLKPMRILNIFPWTQLCIFLRAIQLGEPMIHLIAMGPGPPWPRVGLMEVLIYTGSEVPKGGQHSQLYKHI